MTHHDIIVIGASAGGVQALTTIVRDLGPDLNAAVFVVLHIPAYAASHLPRILTRSGPLPASHAQDRERIEPGHIYIAPPDRHLLIRRGYMELTRGPRENHSRPAIDPLFRSAAASLGPGVIGVVLSGALYDGSAGLLAIKNGGGIAIIQDPNDALIDSMPKNAMRYVVADQILPAAEIGGVLTGLIEAGLSRKDVAAMGDGQERIQSIIASDFVRQAGDQRKEQPSIYTCPDCGGVLWQEVDGPLVRFRCHTGHVFDHEILLGLKAEEVEAALWSSLRLLKEKATLSRQLATRMRDVGDGELAARVDEDARRDQGQIEALHGFLESAPNPADLPV